MSGLVVGIDLGTTNTVVGVVQDGQATAIADTTGERLIPSVVSFHPNGNVLVGRGARERRLNDATNTIYSIKRLIGRSWESEEVTKARSRFPFEMREGPGQAALVVARGETYTLPEISAFVLRKAKALAEEALGASVDRAVITVPANFNDLQRAATKVAGRVAGLEVLRILNEPTAAALAYGYGKANAERIAIYDFGGGTFDVTLLDLSGNVFEVLATAGNTFLGGDDIDLLLAERMADAFLAQHRVDLRENSQSFERLRFAAEQLKCELSTEANATARVLEVAYGPGGKALDLEFNFSRAQFDELCAPYVKQTFDVCQEALNIARLKPSDFDQVLLVGGSTRIPLVKQQVEQFFERPIKEQINPDEVVAIGAAIQANALTGAERRRAEILRPPVPAARRQTGSGLNQLPGAARSSSVPPGLPGRRTNPGIRPGSQTSPGVRTGEYPIRPRTIPPGGRPRTQSQPPVFVPTPTGNEPEPIPHTAEGPGAVRRRQTTGMGLGKPPLPPRTLDGLGARGRIPTGVGLGETGTIEPNAQSAPQAIPPRRVPTGSGLGPMVPAPRVQIPTGRGLGGDVPGSTLISAGEQAQQAQRRAQPSERISIIDSSGPEGTKPLNALSSQDITRAQDTTAELDLGPELTPEEFEMGSSPPTGTPSQPSLDQELREKYGNLPLTMPGEAPKMPAPPLPAKLSTNTLLSSDASGFEPLVASPSIDLGPGPGPGLEDEPKFLEDTNLSLDDGLDIGFEGHSASEALESELSADEITSIDDDALEELVPAGLLELEAALPIPELPPSAGRPPIPSGTLQMEAPKFPPAAPSFGQTVALPAQAAPNFGQTAVLPGQAQGQPFHQTPAPSGLAEQAAWGQHAPVPNRAPIAAQVGFGQGTPLIHEMGGPPHPGVAPEPGFTAHSPSSPLLIDVTPLSLAIETVGGYCDRIITRNTPVPCEETRQFVTARDNQTSVRIRISQGESNRFLDNTLLGELDLSGLRPAQRGQVTISVTFSLDANGMLNVGAVDLQTGQSTSAVVRLVGAPDADVAALQARNFAHPM